MEEMRNGAFALNEDELNQVVGGIRRGSGYIADAEDPENDSKSIVCKKCGAVKMKTASGYVCKSKMCAQMMI